MTPLLYHHFPRQITGFMMFYVIFPQVHEARPHVHHVRLRYLLVFVHHIHLRKVKAMGIATPVAIILVIQSMRRVFRTHLARLHQHLVSGPTCAGTPQAWDNRKTPARLPVFFYCFQTLPPWKRVAIGDPLTASSHGGPIVPGPIAISIATGHRDGQFPLSLRLRQRFFLIASIF